MSYVKFTSNEGNHMYEKKNDLLILEKTANMRDSKEYFLDRHPKMLQHSFYSII